MYAHLELEPDLSALPTEEQVALRRALAKEPGRRWGSCNAFVNELTAAARKQEEEHQRRQEEERRRREAERIQYEQERLKRSAETEAHARAEREQQGAGQVCDCLDGLFTEEQRKAEEERRRRNVERIQREKERLRRDSEETAKRRQEAERGQREQDRQRQGSAPARDRQEQCSDPPPPEYEVTKALAVCLAIILFPPAVMFGYGSPSPATPPVWAVTLQQKEEWLKAQPTPWEKASVGEKTKRLALAEAFFATGPVVLACWGYFSAKRDERRWCQQVPGRTPADLKRARERLARAKSEGLKDRPLQV